MDSSTLKRHNSFQNQNNGKATHTFAPRPLNFNLKHGDISPWLKQEVLTFNDLCVSWSSAKS